MNFSIKNVLAVVGAVVGVSGLAYLCVSVSQENARKNAARKEIERQIHITGRAVARREREDRLRARAVEDRAAKSVSLKP